MVERLGSGRLAGKVAIVVGAGQSPGSGPDDDTIGNGRATALLFAREGAKGSPSIADSTLRKRQWI